MNGTGALGRVFPWLLLLLLCPGAALASMPLTEAREHLEAGRLDEVFFAFVAMKPGVHPEGDPAVAALLVESAEAALGADDAVLAVGFTDAARLLDPRSVKACLLSAEGSLRLRQRSAAEEALAAALALAPDRADVVLRNAVFAEEEGRFDRARELLRKIPPSAPEHPEAKRRLQSIDAAISERDRALGETKRLEADAQRRQKEAAKQAGRSLAPVATSGRGTAFDRGTGGMVGRQSDHFRVLYNSGDRDFAQKAAYEQKVLDIFEDAWRRVGQRLGHYPGQPVDVVLYTAEEFELHFGGAFGGALLGFYAGKIRMNRSERLDASFTATAVHEYVHAAVDSLSGYRSERIPVWLNEGLARWLERAITGGAYVLPDEREVLRYAMRSGQSFTFEELASTGFGKLGGRAMIAYARSSAAIQVLTSGGGGLSRIATVIRETGNGVPFEKAFADQFGSQKLSRLDAEVDALIR